MTDYTPPPVGNLGSINGVPFITVSPLGIANSGSSLVNNGANYGPDTPGTTTSGVQEAINLIVANAAGQENNTGPLWAIFAPGTYECGTPLYIFSPTSTTIQNLGGIHLTGQTQGVGANGNAVLKAQSGISTSGAFFSMIGNQSYWTSNTTGSTMIGMIMENFLLDCNSKAFTKGLDFSMPEKSTNSRISGVAFAGTANLTVTTADFSGWEDLIVEHLDTGAISSNPQLPTLTYNQGGGRGLFLRGNWNAALVSGPGILFISPATFTNLTIGAVPTRVNPSPGSRVEVTIMNVDTGNVNTLDLNWLQVPNNAALSYLSSVDVSLIGSAFNICPGYSAFSNQLSGSTLNIHQYGQLRISRGGSGTNPTLVDATSTGTVSLIDWTDWAIVYSNVTDNSSSYSAYLASFTTTSTASESTTSTSDVMAGFSSASPALSSFTPKTTGIVRLTASGWVNNSTSGDTVNVKGRYGTSSATNGQATTGFTAWYALNNANRSSAASAWVPFFMDAVVSLTVGTTYYLDFSFFGNASTANMDNVSYTVMELAH